MRSGARSQRCSRCAGLRSALRCAVLVFVLCVVFFSKSAPLVALRAERAQHTTMSEPEAATVLDSADVGAVAPIAGERDPACRICSFYHDENNADAAALVAARNDRWCLRVGDE